MDKTTLVVHQGTMANIRIHWSIIEETCKDRIRQANDNTKQVVDRENKRRISIHMSFIEEPTPEYGNSGCSSRKQG